MLPARSVLYLIHVLLVFITAKEKRKVRKYSRKSWQTLLNQPSRGLPKMFPPRNTGIHFCFPLSINHQRFLIHQRKERARKEEPKIEQITLLTVITHMKGKQKRKWTVLNHRSQSLIHSEYCVYLIQFISTLCMVIYKLSSVCALVEYFFPDISLVLDSQFF